MDPKLAEHEPNSQLASDHTRGPLSIPRRHTQSHLEEKGYFSVSTDYSKNLEESWIPSDSQGKTGQTVQLHLTTELSAAPLQMGLRGKCQKGQWVVNST